MNGRPDAATDVGVVFTDSIDDLHNQLTATAKVAATRLHRIVAVEAYSVGSQRYVFGASRNEGPFLLNVTNPRNIVYFTPSFPGGIGFHDVAVYTDSDDEVQMIGVWGDDDALQRLVVNDSGQLSGSNHVADSAAMDGASGVAVYEIGAKDYAVVTGSFSDSVRVVDISTPTSFVLKGSLEDTAALALDHPNRVEVYTIGSKHYAVVASEEGLQIVDVTDPDNIAASGDLTISDGIFNKLHSVALYSVGSSHYAIVGSLDGNNGVLAGDDVIRGIQIIDVTDPASPSIVSRLSPAAGLVLDRTGDVAVHRVGDRVFAVVPATAPVDSMGFRRTGLSDERIRQTDGFSIVDVTDPASPKPLVSASDSLDDFFDFLGLRLIGARSVTTFTKDGRHYGAVGNYEEVTSSDNRDGVQVFEMVFVTADAGSDQMVDPGSTVTLDGSGSSVTNSGNLTYNWTQVSGPDVVLTPVSGNPQQVTFTAPSTVSDLVFNLTVSQGAPSHVVDVDEVAVSVTVPTALTLTTSATNNSVGEGGGSVTVTATLDRPALSGGVAVTLTASGSATAGSDYVLPGVFTIPAGKTSATANVRIVDDDSPESSETVVLSASVSVSGLSVTPVTLTVADDDVAGVTVSAQSVSAFEGFTATYTVRLNTQPTAQVTVTPTSATTAAATVSGALTFTTSNWKSPQQVTVTGVAAGTSVISHTVVSTDTDYGGVSVADVTATVLVSQTKYSIMSALTIPDDNAARALTVRLGQAAPAGGITFAVAYDFSGSTATRLDLNEAPETVTVGEGDTTAQLRLATRHDEVVEGDETFTVTITANAAAQAAGWTPVSGQNTATVTITDNDTASASVGFGSALQEQPGRRVAYRNTRARVPVSLSRPPAAPVTVEIEVDPSSTATEYVDAQNPGDFRIVDKTVTFTPGGGGSRGTSQTLWVDITNNAETASETIVLRIADHSGGGLGRHYTRYEPNRTYTLELFPRTQSGTPRTPVDPVGPGPVGPVIGGGGPSGGGGGSDDDSGDDRDTQRLAGEDRYATSLRIAEQVAEANDGTLATIVLAGGHSWTDALAAAPLAGALDGALLLTAPDGLAADTITWLAEVGVTDIIAVGDDTHITDAALEALNGIDDDIERITAADPYTTSAAVAARIGRPDTLGPLLGRTVIVASGRKFPDALAAGPLAAAGPHPVLYADTGTLAPEVAAYLAAHADHVIIMGGTAAVDEQIEDQIRDIKQANRPARPMGVTRHAGTDRYHTAALFARWLTGPVLEGRVCFTADTAGLATGTNPADATASGPLLAHRCAPLLLTEPDQMPPHTASFLRRTTELIVFGGTKAIENTALQSWTR